MKFYGIRFKNGQYLGTGKDSCDFTAKTEDITKAYPYINYDNIERTIQGFSNQTKQDYKGACIVELATGKVIKNICVYTKTLRNFKILRQTEKAAMLDILGWIPKTHIDLNTSVGVSDWFWNENLTNYQEFMQNDILDANDIKVKEVI